MKSYMGFCNCAEVDNLERPWMAIMDLQSPLTKYNLLPVLLSSSPGLGLENPRGHLEVLALALDRGLGQDLCKTWEKSWTFSNQLSWFYIYFCEHLLLCCTVLSFTICCYGTVCVQQQLIAKLLIIFTRPLSASHSQQLIILKNHDKL